MSKKTMTDPEIILLRLQSVLDALREAKPSERSELARRYAVTITEMEKIVAYFEIYAVHKADDA